MEQPENSTAEVNGTGRTSNFLRHGDTFLATSNHAGSVGVIPHEAGLVEVAIADIAVASAGAYSGISNTNYPGMMREAASFLRHIASNLEGLAAEVEAATPVSTAHNESHPDHAGS